MSFLWKDWPKPVQAGPGAPRVRDILLPDETWRLVAHGYKDAKGPSCNARGEVFFADTLGNKVYRVDLDGKVDVFLDDAGRADSVSFGPQGQLYAISRATGRIMNYDASGKGVLVADGLPGRFVLAEPGGGLYVTGAGAVWFVKDGRKTQVDSGLKCATGLAYRPDQWLLSVADGRSKWVYSYQIKADRTLVNKERFFWLHVPDGEDDAGAESVCYAREGQMFVATRSGIQVCADDGPTQVILPLPGRRRVIGVCLGGRDMDTLFAFCGDTVWKRRVIPHAMGTFTPWTRVRGSKL